MQLRYGHKWTSNHKTEDIRVLAIKEWAGILGDLAPQEIAIGLKAMEHREDTWPPDVYEFKTLCRPAGNKACHQPYQALPKTPSNAGTAIKAMASMKRALRRRTTASAWQEIHGMRIFTA